MTGPQSHEMFGFYLDPQKADRPFTNIYFDMRVVMLLLEVFVTPQVVPFGNMN